MATHLGYQENGLAKKTTGNRRNGKSKKTLKGDLGEIEIKTPRDREASFEPRIIAKGPDPHGGVGWQNPVDVCAWDDHARHPGAPGGAPVVPSRAVRATPTTLRPRLRLAPHQTRWPPMTTIPGRRPRAPPCAWPHTPLRPCCRSRCVRFEWGWALDFEWALFLALGKRPARIALCRVLAFTPLASATSGTLMPSAIKRSAVCRTSPVSTGTDRRLGTENTLFGP